MGIWDTDTVPYAYCFVLSIGNNRENRGQYAILSPLRPCGGPEMLYCFVLGKVKL